MKEIIELIRDIPDFPKKGIVFKDITPVLADKDAFAKVIEYFKDRYENKGIAVIAGIESRGFIFGSALALALGVGFVPIRKPGKLPYKTIKESYQLEYGEDAVEIHTDAVRPGQNVLLIDDLLATGGTAAASARVIKKLGGNIYEIAFLIELGFLKGKEKLSEYNVHSAIIF